jgi:[acyl-carrier-protein] S-malonyltransferase
MAPASEGIFNAASKIAFGAPAYELFLDMTAGTLREYARAASGETSDGAAADETSRGAPGAAAALIPGIMAAQVKSPVRWQEITEALVAAGADAIVEFGPGRILSGLAKKTAPGVTTLNVQDAESLEETVRALEAGASAFS